MATTEVKVPDIGGFENVPVIEVFVKPGDVVKPEDPLVTLESDKATMDVPAPVAGTVTARNDDLDATPELVNSDPYGGGWIVEITVEDDGALDGLLDADAYAEVAT